MPFLICLGLGPLFSAYFGIKIPFLIAALPKTFTVQDEFRETLVDLSCLFLLIYLNRVFYQMTINLYVSKLIGHVRRRCYSTWMYSWNIYEENQREKNYCLPQGEVQARIVNDMEGFKELMTSGTFGILIDLIFVITSLVTFINVNKTLGISLGIIEIISLIVLIIAGKFLKDAYLSVKNSRGYFLRKIGDIIAGLKESFYFPNDHYAYKSGNKVCTDFLKKQHVANFYDAIYYSTADSLYPITLAFLVMILPYSKISEVAIIFVIIDLLQRSLSPIKEIAGKLANIQRGISGLIRVDLFFKYCEDKINLRCSTEESALQNIKSFKLEISSFTYYRRDDFLIKDISIEAHRGQRIAIIGSSGSGKSTLMKIIAGKIIGKNINISVEEVSGKRTDISKKNIDNLLAYRKKLAFISQESHIFSESLLFNLSFSDKMTEKFKIFWNEIIEEIPYLSSWGFSLEEILCEEELSLGQRQLIIVLRSYYFKRPLILLDEVSSAMDSKLEKILRKVISKIQKQSITLIVAHRIETIVNSDKIYILEKGRIVDAGDHRTLLVSSQKYNHFIQEFQKVIKVTKD